MPGDTKVLYTDEFQKDVAKIKDNLIRGRIKKLLQQLIDNPKETADEGQTVKIQFKIEQIKVNLITYSFFVTISVFYYIYFGLKIRLSLI